MVKEETVLHLKVVIWYGCLFLQGNELDDLTKTGLDRKISVGGSHLDKTLIQ